MHLYLDLFKKILFDSPTLTQISQKLVFVVGNSKKQLLCQLKYLNQDQHVRQVP